MWSIFQNVHPDKSTSCTFGISLGHVVNIKCFSASCNLYLPLDNSYLHAFIINANDFNTLSLILTLFLADASSTVLANFLAKLLSFISHLILSVPVICICICFSVHLNTWLFYSRRFTVSFPFSTRHVTVCSACMSGKPILIIFEGQIMYILMYEILRTSDISWSLFKRFAI